MSKQKSSVAPRAMALFATSALLGVCLVLSGCGQIGPLTLPPSAQKASPAAAPAVSAPSPSSASAPR